MRSDIASTKDQLRTYFNIEDIESQKHWFEYTHIEGLNGLNRKGAYDKEELDEGKGLESKIFYYSEAKHIALSSSDDKDSKDPTIL